MPGRRPLAVRPRPLIPSAVGGAKRLCVRKVLKDLAVADAFVGCCLGVAARAEEEAKIGMDQLGSLPNFKAAAPVSRAAVASTSVQR